MSDCSHITDGYHTVIPYLVCKGTADAIDFYKDVFGATEDMRMEIPGGGGGQAELTDGNSMIMLGDECPDMDFLSPQSVGGTPVGICLYVADCDAMFQLAVDKGAQMKKPMQDQFFGDRSGAVVDPWGHLWTMATRKETLTEEQIRERSAEFMKQMAEGKGAPLTE